MGAMNLAVASLVEAIRGLLADDGWQGWGIKSPEHWVAWKACVSPHRAQDLVRVARRADELPQLYAMFREGRLTEDVMVRLAKRLPSSRDAEMARTITQLMVSQLDRILRHLPELPDGEPKLSTGYERTRTASVRRDGEGWLHGEFCLPPDEGAAIQAGLDSARDRLYRADNALDDGAEVTAGQRFAVPVVDALVALLGAGTDALDATLARTGRVGDRHHVVLHHDVDPHGALGPGQLHASVVVPDTLARFLACDATVQVALYRAGRLLGINPAQRTVSRALRRVIERRDQGCVHPLCQRRRHLHIHHLHHWSDGGPTSAENLVALCGEHHRALHQRDISITGNPETRSLVVHDARGTPIQPPAFGPVAGPAPATTYEEPYGGTLATGSWTWN